MRIFFYIGLVLLALGFVAAAAENAAHAMPGTISSFILSAHDLWYALWPTSLIIFEIKIQRLFGDWLWDPVILTILEIPGWLIFGGPGAALLLLFRPNRGQDNREEMAEAAESFTLFDDLTKQALDEIPSGEEHGPNDIMPQYPIDDDETVNEENPHN